MFKLSVTGHRPNKIHYSLYDVNSVLSKKYIKFFQNYILKLISENTGKTIHCISGMALGIDSLFAIAVIKLKEAGHPVQLEAAIPCKNQSCKWVPESIRVYNKILSQTNTTTFVSDKEYTPNCMQLRNEYMVNHSNLVLAIWDGTSGGTGNCVKYAQSIKKVVDIITPMEALK